jgi:RNA polymerase sigma-70 factor, ECF subfamily
MEPWAGVDEQQLIARAQAGQAEAYGELVRRYQTRVYSVIYRMVGNQQDALDLAQEVFVRAYESIAGFAPGRPFGPWIARVAANLTLNWLQRRRLPTVTLEPENHEAPGAARSPPDYAYEPERVYLSAERQAQIRAAIAALPPHYRAVIELRHLQDMPYETIAATLNIPLSDVKSHLFRARQQLRERMKDEG